MGKLQLKSFCWGGGSVNHAQFQFAITRSQTDQKHLEKSFIQHFMQNLKKHSANW